jgi:transcriptional regulator with XRE-family HTH domain
MEEISPAYIRRVMTIYGYTQEQLAQRIGVKQATVSRWLKNTSRPIYPSDAKLRALSHARLDTIILRPDEFRDLLAAGEYVEASMAYAKLYARVQDVGGLW